MLFNSLEYLLFLPIVFAIYWLLRNQLKLQNLFVVLASYVFYGWWDWRFLILIAFTSICSWGSGLLIHRTPYTIHHTPMPKFWLWLNIAINLGILAVFKYYDFFVSEFGALFGVDTESLLLRIILPVGISFYTFQALSYSIDVYRGNIKPTRDIIAFFAFISFFPQLVAGPIERATNLLPQFLQKRTFKYEQGVDGMRQILWGLFKKIVIADNCAMYVDQVWSTYDTQSGSTLLLAAILFTFQIYGDFSGYSDIAIGTAKLFGIKLMRNFNNPYFSRDIAEFWRRWHISLTSWFQDYVYIPLGGSRPTIADCWFIGKTKTQINTVPEINNENILVNQKSGDSECCEQHALRASADSVIVSELPLQNHPIPSNSVSEDTESSPNKKVDCINQQKNQKNSHADSIETKNAENGSWKKWVIVRNTFIIFLLSGFWHGANWTFIAWGTYHAVLFLPLILLGKNRKYIGRVADNRCLPTWKEALQMLLTFVLVLIGWIIFRADTIGQAWEIVDKICSDSLWDKAYIGGLGSLAFTALAIVVMIGAEWLQRNEDHGLVLDGMNSRLLRYAIYIVLITMMLWNGEPGDAFIYFQF